MERARREEFTPEIPVLIWGLQHFSNMKTLCVHLGSYRKHWHSVYKIGQQTDAELYAGKEAKILKNIDRHDRFGDVNRKSLFLCRKLPDYWEEMSLTFNIHSLQPSTFTADASIAMVGVIVYLFLTCPSTVSSLFTIMTLPWEAKIRNVSIP